MRCPCLLGRDICICDVPIEDLVAAEKARWPGNPAETTRLLLTYLSKENKNKFSAREILEAMNISPQKHVMNSVCYALKVGILKKLDRGVYRLSRANLINHLPNESKVMNDPETEEPFGDEIEALTPEEAKYIHEAPGWYLVVGEPSYILKKLVNKGLIRHDGATWETTRHAQRLVEEYKAALS